MESEVDLNAVSSGKSKINAKSILKENQKQFFEKCMFKKPEPTTNATDITVEDIESSHEEEHTTEQECKTKTCSNEITALRNIIQTQAKKIERLEEQLSKMSDVQDESEPDGVEIKNNKSSRGIS